MPARSMNRLKLYFARGRTLGLTVLALVLGPPFLLLFVVLAGLVTDTQVEIDVTWVVLAVAVVVLAAAVFHLVRYWVQPKQTVNVGYALELAQPMTRMGHYTFKLRVHYDSTHKGQSRVTQQAAIEMKFKAKDHPDLLEWCTRQVGGHLEEHRAHAERLYPDAHVTLSPGPTRESIKEELGRS